MADIEYDPEVDAAYVKIRSGRIYESEEVKEGIIVDLDKKGKIIGVEILDFKDRIKPLPAAIKKTNSRRS